MHDDLPHWKAFVRKMKGEADKDMGEPDKVAIWGAERVMEDDGGMGQLPRILSSNKK